MQTVNAARQERWITHAGRTLGPGPASVNPGSAGITATPALRVSTASTVRVRDERRSFIYPD